MTLLPRQFNCRRFYLGIDLSILRGILSTMAAGTAKLDGVFLALASATRRAVVERLRSGPASVTQLAAPFKMALPSFLEHLQILERAGLIRSRKAGRVRTVRINPTQLRQAATWLDKQRGLWEQRLDQFDAYVKTMENPK